MHSKCAGNVTKGTGFYTEQLAEELCNGLSYPDSSAPGMVASVECEKGSVPVTSAEDDEVDAICKERLLSPQVEMEVGVLRHEWHSAII